jgi:hypothetical protein
LTGGSLLITGGGYPYAVREVVRIDTRREFAVSHCALMLTPRTEHAAVYHTPHLYILGGVNGRCLSECERYVCAELRWEALPLLPRACVENSLYALGGYDYEISVSFGAKVELGKPYLGALAVQAPSCRHSYLLFQAERH